MDFSQARRNMVDGQLTPNKIVNHDVIKRFLKVPREFFVDVSCKNMAYRDNSVKLTSGRYMFPPMVAAHMIQALNPTQSDSVLIVASATGYTASILCDLVNSVYGVEDNLNLLEISRRALLDASCKSVLLFEGSPDKGLESKGPYSKVLIDTAVDYVPDTLFDQLQVGGTLVAVIKKNEYVSTLMAYTKLESGKVEKKSVREVVTTPVHAKFQNEINFEF